MYPSHFYPPQPSTAPMYPSQSRARPQQRPVTPDFGSVSLGQRLAGVHANATSPFIPNPARTEFQPLAAPTFPSHSDPRGSIFPDNSHGTTSRSAWTDGTIYSNFPQTAPAQTYPFIPAQRTTPQPPPYPPFDNGEYYDPALGNHAMYRPTSSSASYASPSGGSLYPDAYTNVPATFEQTLGPNKNSRTKPRQNLSCLFCRGRKIACKAPPNGESMCDQCTKRGRPTCVFPTQSQRGLHPRIKAVLREELDADGML